MVPGDRVGELLFRGEGLQTLLRWDPLHRRGDRGAQKWTFLPTGLQGNKPRSAGCENEVTLSLKPTRVRCTRRFRLRETQRHSSDGGRWGGNRVRVPEPGVKAQPVSGPHRVAVSWGSADVARRGLVPPPRPPAARASPAQFCPRGPPTATAWVAREPRGEGAISAQGAPPVPPAHPPRG